MQHSQIDSSRYHFSKALVHSESSHKITFFLKNVQCWEFFLNIDPIYHVVILGFVRIRKPKVLSWKGLSFVSECVLSSHSLGIRSPFIL